MTIQEKYAAALPLVNSGDIGLFRGRALISDAIELVTKSYWSHSEVLYWQNGKLMCIDATGKGVNADFLINTIDSEEDFAILRVDRPQAMIDAAVLKVIGLATGKVRYNYLFYAQILLYKLFHKDFTHLSEKHADVCSQTVQVFGVNLTPPLWQDNSAPTNLITPEYIWDNPGLGTKIIIDKGL